MRNMLKIILISISLLFSAKESYDEIDYLISFDKKQKSIAKGQFVAIYNGDNLISS